MCIYLNSFLPSNNDEVSVVRETQVSQNELRHSIIHHPQYQKIRTISSTFRSL
ncbi:hypothetical protein T01_7211 [Trichinella spiralis]|uniref:Uncharacterized protein n=1 Tax=Trichinella spiralis TaxID=6334 RepID=A0A0V1ALC1_TRISP|nr:hypothetical protein T01_7211 [Trichinella spiralis]